MKVLRVASVKDDKACDADWSKEYGDIPGGRKSGGFTGCDGKCGNDVGFPHVHAWMEEGFRIFCAPCAMGIKKGSEL